MNPMNKHIHLSREELMQYVYNDKFLEQHVIEQIELELQLCEVCSDRYMRVMEGIEVSEHSIQTRQAVENIITKIEVMNEHEQKTKQLQSKKWYEYSSVQFVAAASITGVLFISGFLSFITTTGSEPVGPQTVEEKVWLELETPQWLINLDSQLPDLKGKFQIFKEEEEK